MKNQAYEKKVSFKDASRARPVVHVPKDLSDNMYTRNMNVTNNVESNITNTNEKQKSATVTSASKPSVADKLKGKVADAMVRQSTEANNNQNLDTKAAENEEYVYRGPKNNTGIFKNSLVLQDLTGFVAEPEKHPGDKTAHETFEAGTQTIIYEDSKVLDVVGQTERLAEYDTEMELNDKSRADSAIDLAKREAERKNSAEREALERENAEAEAKLEALRQHNKHVTNQINQQITI